MKKDTSGLIPKAALEDRKSILRSITQRKDQIAKK